MSSKKSKWPWLWIACLLMSLTLGSGCDYDVEEYQGHWVGRDCVKGGRECTATIIRFKTTDR